MNDKYLKRWGGFFNCNWAAFDNGTALKYTISVVAVWALSKVTGFSWLIAQALSHS